MADYFHLVNENEAGKSGARQAGFRDAINPTWERHDERAVRYTSDGFPADLSGVEHALTAALYRAPDVREARTDA